MSVTRIKPEDETADSEIKTVSPEEPNNDTTVEAVATLLPSRRPAFASSRRKATALLLRSLVAVLIGSLILRVAAQMMGLMLQSYFGKIEISYTATGFVTASFFIAELLGSPVLGALSDYYGRKRFIILGPLFGAIAVQITSMTMAIWLLVITRLLEGLSTASAIPAMLGYISEATSARPKLRARVIGLFEITFVGGMAIGAGLAGYVWKYFGDEATLAGIHFRSPAFSINGLIYLLSLAVFAWGLKNVRRRRSASPVAGAHEKWGHYREILRSPRVWKLVPAWVSINSVIGIWFNYSIRLLTESDRSRLYEGQMLMGHWQNVPEKVYLGFAAFLLIFALGVLAWSFFLGSHRRTSVMLIATVGLAAIVPAIYVLNHLGSFDRPAYYLMAGVLLVGIIVLSGFAPAALTYLADVTEVHSEDRGSIMGLYSVFLGVGQFVGTATGGVFANMGGIDGLLVLSAIFGMITALSLATLRKQEISAATRSSRP